MKAKFLKFQKNWEWNILKNAVIVNIYTLESREIANS